jgi:predicted transcriptional regulator
VIHVYLGTLSINRDDGDGGDRLERPQRRCTLHYSAARAAGKEAGFVRQPRGMAGMADRARLTVRVSAETLAKLDKTAAERGLSRSGALRALLEGDLPQGAPADYGEALLLLAESARSGSVPARVALERALRTADSDPIQRRLDELATRRRARQERPA